MRRSLAEDLGEAGDLTTDTIVAPDLQAEGRLVTRAAGCIAGLPVALQAFRMVDPSIDMDVECGDGEVAEAGTLLARVRGSARGLLTGERTALNLLCHLSGVATTTRSLVDAIGTRPPWVVCTRKTTPGLRSLEKYAVRAGGGANHRFGLDDAVLIKDNHIALAGGVEEAVARARRGLGHMVKVEVEVDSLAQLEEVLPLGVDAVLLDNMGPELLRRAVETCRRHEGSSVLTEASGGITPETAPSLAATGVDLLSVGWLTHSAPALDIGFDFAPLA